MTLLNEIADKNEEHNEALQKQLTKPVCVSVSVSLALSACSLSHSFCLSVCVFICVCMCVSASQKKGKKKAVKKGPRRDLDEEKADKEIRAQMKPVLRGDELLKLFEKARAPTLFAADQIYALGAMLVLPASLLPE